MHALPVQIWPAPWQLAMDDVTVTKAALSDDKVVLKAVAREAVVESEEDSATSTELTAVTRVAEELTAETAEEADVETEVTVAESVETAEEVAYDVMAPLRLAMLLLAVLATVLTALMEEPWDESVALRLDTVLEVA